jgi:predicted NAD-dependent protein-ADP-ribosyltransferase YbiA (DUF1768 family)
MKDSANKKILSFDGEERWLSNFWPCTVELYGEAYPSIEHAYQAAKALHPEDRKIFQSPDMTAGQAKRSGRRLAMRLDWEVVKVPTMWNLIQQKYCSSSTLGHKLADLWDWHIEEGNTWGDTFWGVCRGRGDNRLGKLLMAQAEELDTARGLSGFPEEE